MITIRCIYFKDATTIKKYIKDIDNNSIINYMDIFNKLSKNDIYGNEPTDLIVSSFLIKELEQFILIDDNLDFWYVLSTLDKDVLYNLKNVIYKINKRQSFQLNLYTESESYNEKLYLIFDNIIVNDKA